MQIPYVFQSLVVNIHAHYHTLLTHEHISTDITDLEVELERLREDFQDKVRLIIRKINEIKR